MATGWTPADYDLMREARQGDIAFLEDLDGGHFEQRKPIIAISCPDYRRNCDMVGRVAKLRGYEPGEDHQTHSLGWHGGIIRLVPDFPGNTPESAAVFLEELRLAVEVTGIKDVVGYIHWPCGKLLRHEVPLKAAFAGLIAAKQVAKDAIGGGLKVRTVVHSDYGAELEPHGMKSYFARPPRVRMWLTQTDLQTA